MSGEVSSICRNLIQAVGEGDLESSMNEFYRIQSYSKSVRFALVEIRSHLGLLFLGENTENGRIQGLYKGIVRSKFHGELKIFKDVIIQILTPSRHVLDDFNIITKKKRENHESKIWKDLHIVGKSKDSDGFDRDKKKIENEFYLNMYPKGNIPSFLYTLFLYGENPSQDFIHFLKKLGIFGRSDSVNESEKRKKDFFNDKFLNGEVESNILLYGFEMDFYWSGIDTEGNPVKINFELDAYKNQRKYLTENGRYKLRSKYKNRDDFLKSYFGIQVIRILHFSRHSISLDFS